MRMLQMALTLDLQKCMEVSQAVLFGFKLGNLIGQRSESILRALQQVIKGR
ncbi:hypothetical protein D3C85_1929320 [compost metagenome]